MFDVTKPLRSAASLAALLTFTAASCIAQKDLRISPDLGKVSTAGEVPVIIQYKTAPTSAELSLLETLSGHTPYLLNSIHAVVVSLPQSALSTLTQDTNVAYVSANRAMSAKQVSTTSAEYTTEPINAPAVWANGYVGTGIGIAVIDSGINPVPDLSVYGKKNQTRIVYNQSFVASDPTDAGDYYGHGTHVAGLIAGNGTLSTGKQYFRTFYGSAPNANLINLRVLDQNGQGSDAAVIEAIETAISLRNRYNIKVINLSIGREIFESFALDPVCQAVEQAWQAGIMVVVAAGNDGRNLALNPEGYGTIEAPGNDPFPLTVGAVKSMGTATIVDDQMASYSSKGPSYIDHVVKPDIIAPGNVVTSLQFPNDPLVSESAFVTLDSFYRVNGPAIPSTDYFPLSGTSMSTAVVSGAVADLFQAQPNISPDEAKAFIMRNGDRKYLPATSIAVDPTSGTSYTAHNDVFTIGAGYLDIAATINSVLANRTRMPVGAALSPVAAYNPGSNSVFLLREPGALWGYSFTQTIPPASHEGPQPQQSTAPLTWNPSDVYGASAFSSQTASAFAIWGWTPLYGASNVMGQPVVAGVAGPGALWGVNSILNPADTSAFTALWGNGTPLWGTGTPLWGTGTPLWGTGTPLWGTGTPLWGTTTPLWGTGTPLWGTGTPLWGTGTPLWGTGTPLWGTGTPLWGTGTPLWGTGTPLWGTGTPLWGTSTPQATDTLWGTSTVGATSTGWGASTPQGSSVPVWSTSAPYEY